jgi:hypothetical protein
MADHPAHHTMERLISAQAGTDDFARRGAASSMLDLLGDPFPDETDDRIAAREYLTWVAAGEPARKKLRRKTL